jgi:hypothetical protein
MIDGRINYGINREAAQVIDTRFYTQQILRQQEMNEHRRMRDQQEVASMLSKLTPDKLRSADIPEFNQKYNQLKDLYIQNNGLYRRPADHPIEFKKAQTLQSELQQLIAESKEVDGTLGKVGQTIFEKGDDEFEDDAIALSKNLTSLPTSKIKEQFGGRLVSFEDFAHKPKPIDYDKIRKEIDGLGMTTEDSIILRGKENGVPEGKIRVRFDKVTDPAAIDMVTNSKWSSQSGFRKTYGNLFRDIQKIDPGRIEEMQQEIDQRFGEGKFQISDPLSFAKADLLLRYNREPGESKLTNDEEWDRRNKLADDQRNFNQDLYKIGERDRLARERDLIKADNKKKNTKDSEDELMKEANSMIGGLKEYASLDEKGKLSAKSKLAPLYKHPKLRDKIGLIEPQKKKDFAEFYKAVQDNKGPFKISEKEARDLYDSGTPLLRVVLPTGKEKDGDGNTIMVDEVNLINPQHVSSAARLYALLKKAGGTRKYGIEENFSDEDEDD